MSQKGVQDYLNNTPGADIEDVMFIFPEMTFQEAARAVQRQKFSWLFRWWPLVAGIFARFLQERYRQRT